MLPLELPHHFQPSSYATILNVMVECSALLMGMVTSPAELLILYEVLFSEFAQSLKSPATFQ